MLHRVSSRPRLVSDADAAFHAAVEVNEDEFDRHQNSSASKTTIVTQETSFDDDESSYVTCLENSLSRSASLVSLVVDDGNGSKGKRFPVFNIASLKSPQSVRGDGAALVTAASDGEVSTYADINSPSLDSLPAEAIISIATYLPSPQLRILASVNASFRKMLIYSQGAKENLWMEVMRTEFSQIFSKSPLIDNGGKRRGFDENNMLTSAQVSFVDSSYDVTDGSVLNLSLLTGLFPKRYPREIDDVLSRVHFRTFGCVLDGTLLNGNRIGEEEEDDNEQKTPSQGIAEKKISNKSGMVPVVQFKGRVGTGDRCIRSDQAFPSPKHVSISYKKNRFGRLKSSVFKSSRNNAVAAPSTTADVPDQETPVPLLRFLSSLSHLSEDPTLVASTSSTSDYGHYIADDDDDEEIGTNNYGMFPFNKCKEKWSKLKNGKKQELKPFVVPTVISRCDANAKKSNTTQQNDLQKKLVVDLTPSFIAYFEVTILKHSDLTKLQTTQVEQPDNTNHLPPDNRIDNNRQVIIRNAHIRHQRLRHIRRNPHNRIPVPILLYDDWWIQFQPPVNQPIHHTGRVRHECVAIGLSTQAFSPYDKMPGWDVHSYGYHGDDGGIFHGHGDMIREYGPSFGPGDVIGCGVDYRMKKVFFVKNGVFLGYAFDLSEGMLERGLYPTVGVDTECPLFVNFGMRPFCFDLRGFVGDGEE